MTVVQADGAGPGEDRAGPDGRPDPAASGGDLTGGGAPGRRDPAVAGWCWSVPGAVPAHRPVRPAVPARSPEAVAVGAATPRIPGRTRRERPERWERLIRAAPTPATAPFTLIYALVLLGTGLFVHLGDPRTVHDLLTGSSTDVSHLSRRPLFTLLASAVWMVGGLASPYLPALLLVLTALERRIGGLRTAAVFLLGHVLATLLTELPVAASVALGHLPHSSLRRLDYGVSYGLIACAGALAVLLRPRARRALVGGIALSLAAASLIGIADPLTDWGHALALLIGLACWPYVRHSARRRAAEPPRDTAADAATG
ncbi:rhomboid-like protein [Streptomyces sp. NPDC048636]|uniref:rhomboid-like protein n=1 Tax=Streptomyces sp. NPDC048636 TaxID=3155762 RepID=UPI00342A9528